jgi:hypothetical protein
MYVLQCVDTSLLIQRTEDDDNRFVHDIYIQQIQKQKIVHTPLLNYLFLHAYGADFHQGILKNRDKKLERIFNSSFRYVNRSVWVDRKQGASLEKGPESGG